MFNRIRLLLNSLLIMNRDWKQGHFKCAYPEKCINVKLGKPIVYRSSYEQRFFNFCDSNKNVLQWGSEVLDIPYIFDIDKRVHKYKPDVFVKMRKEDGSVEEYLIEIKPEGQTKPPRKPKNKTKKAIHNYNYALKEFIKNQNKWKYARRFCETRNWKWKVLTEKNLF